MKEKYVLGSVLVILLMLVSTQTMIMNVVKSDPTIHAGDAFVGNLWISELDVSSVLEETDYIGIGHVNATEDYVLWENGQGNITANWTVDIETETHPEYCIMFSLLVFNIDDNNTELGNDSIMRTYDAEEKYDESGTLLVAIEFDEGFLQTYDEATVVCILNALVKINNTEEATNFTTWAIDRCVIGIGLDEEVSEEPFSRFRTEANVNFSTPFAYSSGWDEENRFDDEDDMLNTITYAQIGKRISEPSGNYNWYLGHIDVELKSNGRLNFNYLDDWTPNLEKMYCKWENDEIVLNTYINYEITGTDPIYNDVYLIYGLRADLVGTVHRSDWINPTLGDTGYMYNNFIIPESENKPPYDKILLIGKLWILLGYRI